MPTVTEVSYDPTLYDNPNTTPGLMGVYPFNHDSTKTVTDKDDRSPPFMFSLHDSNQLPSL